jgi:hypothetical protein
MEDKKPTGIEQYIVDDEELTGMERYEYAVYLLSELLGCGSADIDVIMDMMRTHDDLLEETREYIEDVGVPWSFGAFVSGIENLVRHAINDRISEDLHEGLCEVQIDDNFVAWGGVASSGDIPSPVAEIFAEMCRKGVTDERVENLIKTYKEETDGYDDAE